MTDALPPGSVPATFDLGHGYVVHGARTESGRLLMYEGDVKRVKYRAWCGERRAQLAMRKLKEIVREALEQEAT